MQTVGSACNICKIGVVFADDAQACENCRLVFHRRCLAKPEQCPKCAGDFVAMAQQRAQQASARDAADIAWGRRVIAAICIALVALEAIDIVPALIFATQTLWQMVELLTVLGITAALYSGRGWARAWVMVMCAFGTLFSVAAVWPDVTSWHLPRLFPSLLTLMFFVSYCLLAFSARVSLYFDSRPRAR